MKLRSISSILAVAGFVFLAGCGGDPPTGALEEANQALQAAVAAGAEQYAANELAAARRAYDDASAALEEESGKLFKNFDEVNQKIADAKSKAESAAAAALAGKQRDKGTADSAIASAASVIESARQVLSQAPSGKGNEGDIQQLQADLSGAEADLSAARSAVGSGNFDEARTKAASATQKAQGIEGGVKMAVQKYNDMKEKLRPWYEKI